MDSRIEGDGGGLSDRDRIRSRDAYAQFPVGVVGEIEFYWRIEDRQHPWSGSRTGESGQRPGREGVQQTRAEVSGGIHLDRSQRVGRDADSAVDVGYRNLQRVERFEQNSESRRGGRQ